MRVKVCNICRSFGAIKAADKVSFELEEGKCYGFVGPNGSGKTTALRIMAGIDRPDSGDVLFDDISVVVYPDRARKYIGYMPDALPGYKDLCVWEYLDFFAHSFGFTGAQRAKRLAEVEEFTGVTSFRTSFLHTLSKGMKQRVSLARAMMHRPRVLLLDEPAAGLDPVARYDLRVMLKKLSEDGMTIFMSSHILSELQDMCEGAVILKNGRVVAAGLMSELQERLDANGEVSPETAEPHIALTLRTLNASEMLEKLLLALPECDGVTVESASEVRVRLKGHDAAIPAILQKVLQSGVPLVGVQKLEMGLEEMFLKFTR